MSSRKKKKVIVQQQQEQEQSELIGSADYIASHEIDQIIKKGVFNNKANTRTLGGKNARKKRERQKQLDDIKDDEVKRELAKGNTLISYIEYQPQ